MESVPSTMPISKQIESRPEPIIESASIPPTSSAIASASLVVILLGLFDHDYQASFSGSDHWHDTSVGHSYSSSGIPHDHAPVNLFFSDHSFTGRG